MKIHILSAPSKLTHQLRAYFQSYVLSEDSITSGADIPSEREFDSLIIHDPIKIEKSFIHRAPLIKKFLNLHFPEVKLIVVSTIPVEHPNYLDLFQLPEDFYKFMSRLYPCGRKWDLEYSNALDSKLAHFFAGHGESSFMQQASNFRMSLNNAYSEWEECGENPDSYPEIVNNFITIAIKQWSTLYFRWVKYKPFIMETPFYEKFLDAESDILLIKKFIENKEKYLEYTIFSKGNYFKAFDNLYKSLANVRDTYIEN